MDRLRRDPGGRRHCARRRIGQADFVALVLALEKLRDAGQISRAIPVTDVYACRHQRRRRRRQTPILDLAYEEDSRAEVDMNVIKTSAGLFIEAQGTAEAQTVLTRRDGLAPRTCRHRLSAQLVTMQAVRVSSGRF